MYVSESNGNMIPQSKIYCMIDHSSFLPCAKICIYLPAARWPGVHLPTALFDASCIDVVQGLPNGVIHLQAANCIAHF